MDSSEQCWELEKDKYFFLIILRLDLKEVHELTISEVQDQFMVNQLNKQWTY